jgi:hypothetical protein
LREGVNRALLTSAVIALVAVAADARAEDTVVLRKVTASPGSALVASGTILLSLGYGVAAVTAASTTYEKDRFLLVPIAGPWIDLGLRPPSTSDENWARFGLVVDGVAQLAGLILVVTGLVMKAHAPRSVSAFVTPTTTGVSLSF